ncbi:MAG: Fur family transcriptional regulator [Candidatus Geothermincolia bacterium]
MTAGGEGTALRMTRQRRVILEELRKVDSHPSAEQIYELVRARLPHVSLGTVYRNLEVLSRLGLIMKLERAGRERRYDGNPALHQHARCVRCGRVVDLPAGAVRSVSTPRSVAGFRVTGYRLELEGICRECSHQTSVK